MEQHLSPTQQRRTAIIQNLYEAAFSWNIASALGIALFICVVINMIEYVGDHNVRVHGRQTGTITEAQLTQILQKLDSIQFSTIEDRAFQWAFDTPSIEVSVSIDGKTKRVVSDEMVVGSKNGQQLQFVRTAHEIDNIIGSEQWVRCPGHCM